MADRDSDSPMQAPRKTRDIMTSAAGAPKPEHQPPTQPATDKATDAVELGQEGG